MKKLRLAVCTWAALSAATVVLGFNGHTASTGPLTVAIGEIPVIRTPAVPIACPVTLTNAGPTPLIVGLEMTGLIDDCHAVGDTHRSVTVPALGATTATFQFVCGPETYSAHYPVHIVATVTSAGGPLAAHAVRIFETDFARESGNAAPASAEPPLTRVPAQGALALSDVKTQRVAWSYAGEPVVRLPVAWTGTDPVSSASFSRTAIVRGDETKVALQMHPPYRPRAGTVFAEYRLQLPATTPLHLTFFNAIRDSTPREGRSDGVTFRVWVGERKIFERHTDAKTWLPGDADLSEFAGKEILLRLESHPGPQNNTTCDSSFWGEPVIGAGPRPRLLTEAERNALFSQARRVLSDPLDRPADALIYDLEGGCRAVVLLGPNGLADGVIGFGAGDRHVLFSGLHLAVREHLVGAWPSAATVTSVESRRPAAGRTAITHRLTVGEQSVALVATLWAEGPGLRIKVECPTTITGIGLNAADQLAPRVYYGHGYCIVDPEAFRANAGGHNLSTSHVGFDFAQGVSLLAASDTPVDYLQVDPRRRLYQLHTHPDATLTFVPGLRGALDCAIRYRPLVTATAAPGVRHKAGRFVFDLWGGRYADNAAKLARAFDYGLTHSLVVVHNWQRWGYDYRLPDIFPPQPGLGSLADLQDLGRLCRARGVLWGLHDNYIDFYPDATGFSYDHITFTADGRPRRAWLNEGREAQSYQFRPDHIRPFLQRNLDLIIPALRPTTSFVDVFASLSSFEFHDRSGNLHSKLETQRAWGEAFAALRDACGSQAPTISEAGGDHLIGWLDGADAQFMLLSPRPEPFHNVVRCRDWERVPWFDAVNHTRFSLHGVGYSDRYQGGRSREEHGIESDDYLSAELLTGHALMIDLAAMGRGAVRKYWLAQDFIGSVALDEIRDVQFADGDLHRLVVTWHSGARIHVNRGESDWVVEGHTLPSYGFWAKHGAIEAGIERLGTSIAEQSRTPRTFYFNSRVFAPAAPRPITPQVARLESLGARKFRLVVNWDAQRGTPRDCAVFYHFSRSTPGRRALTEFVGGGTPTFPTSQWRGRISTGGDWTITIPDEMPPGEYQVLVGLHDLRNRGSRERLLGDEDSRRRYRVGKIVVGSPRAGDDPAIRFEAPARPFVPSPRWLASEGPVDFGPARTDGACRVEVAANHLVVTPLPDGEPFDLLLRLDRLLGRAVTVGAIEVINAAGTVLSTVPARQNDHKLTLPIARDTFAYRVNFQ